MVLTPRFNQVGTRGLWVQTQGLRDVAMFQGAAPPTGVPAIPSSGVWEGTSWVCSLRRGGAERSFLLPLENLHTVPVAVKPRGGDFRTVGWKPLSCGLFTAPGGCLGCE